MCVCIAGSQKRGEERRGEERREERSYDLTAL